MITAKVHHWVHGRQGTNAHRTLVGRGRRGLVARQRGSAGRRWKGLAQREVGTFCGHRQEDTWAMAPPRFSVAGFTPCLKIKSIKVSGHRPILVGTGQNRSWTDQIWHWSMLVLPGWNKHVRHLTPKVVDVNLSLGCWKRSRLHILRASVAKGTQRYHCWFKSITVPESCYWEISLLKCAKRIVTVFPVTHIHLSPPKQREATTVITFGHKAMSHHFKSSISWTNYFSPSKFFPIKMTIWMVYRTLNHTQIQHWWSYVLIVYTWLSHEIITMQFLLVKYPQCLMRFLRKTPIPLLAASRFCWP